MNIFFDSLSILCCDHGRDRERERGKGKDGVLEDNRNSLRIDISTLDGEIYLLAFSTFTKLLFSDSLSLSLPLFTLGHFQIYSVLSFSLSPAPFYPCFLTLIARILTSPHALLRSVVFTPSFIFFSLFLCYYFSFSLSLSLSHIIRHDSSNSYMLVLLLSKFDCCTCAC